MSKVRKYIFTPSDGIIRYWFLMGRNFMFPAPPSALGSMVKRTIKNAKRLNWRWREE